MSTVPIGSSVMDGVAAGHGQPGGENIQRKYPGVVFSQFTGAEIVAKKFDISREEMENMALESHKRAAEATKNGYFKKEIVVVKGVDKSGTEVLHEHDEVLHVSVC